MLKSELETLIEPLLEEPFFFVDLELSSSGPGPVLRVFLDTDAGITIEECALWSRRLGDFLDVREVFPSRYVLEVASPGLSRPLKRERQFRKNLGRELEIWLQEPEEASGDHFTGRLTDVTEQGITLAVNGGEERRVPWSNLGKAKLVISFTNS